MPQGDFEPQDEELQAELNRLRALSDQGRAGLSEMAQTFGSYFADLLRAGFRREEALHIVVAYQEITFMTAPPPEEDPDAPSGG